MKSDPGLFVKPPPRFGRRTYANRWRLPLPRIGAAVRARHRRIPQDPLPRTSTSRSTP